MKKMGSYILILALLIGVINVGNINSAQAVSKKTNALKAYKKKLSHYGGGDSFWVYDLNHDGTPELLIYENMYQVIYTFYKNKIVRAGDFVSGSIMLNYYKKGSVFSSGRLLGSTFYEGHYKISKGKIKSVASKLEPEIDTENVEYTIAGKKTTKKKYNAYINKLTKKSKSMSLNYYTVNSNNIAKLLK